MLEGGDTGRSNVQRYYLLRARQVVPVRKAHGQEEKEEKTAGHKTYAVPSNIGTLDKNL